MLGVSQPWVGCVILSAGEEFFHRSAAKLERKACEREQTVKQLHLTIVALVTLATTSQAQSPPSQLGCSGQLIEPRAKKSSPKTLQLTISSEKVGVDFGSGNVAAKVESNNNIQLKFTTDEFTGEYFHYTGDLFLIYKDGHLARLACKQG